MLNSLAGHNRAAHLLPLLLLIHALPAAAAQAGGPAWLDADDAVSIRADEAWEELTGEGVHFRGNFEMRSQDWLISAQRADLQGRLDAPERMQLEGLPARLRLSFPQDRQAQSLEGEAERIVYERSGNAVTFSGNACLRQNGNELRSEEIRYDIAAERFTAAGRSGIRFSALPKD